MSTDAQTAANRLNAQSSTGPTTESGKQTSAQNATSHGLFSSPCNGVFPHELEIWSEFTQSFQLDLAPEGIVERTPHRRNYLRRLATSPLPPGRSGTGPRDAKRTVHATPQLQSSIDRARTSAQRSFHRNMAELRRLQTECQFRMEYFPAGRQTENLGLASTRELIPVLQKTAAYDPVSQEISVFQSLKNATARPNWVRSAKSSLVPETSLEPQPQRPGSASCPCGSGNKYKRCCGQNAPAVLGKAG